MKDSIIKLKRILNQAGGVMDLVCGPELQFSQNKTEDVLSIAGDTPTKDLKKQAVTIVTF
jgi:hypothetical protein